MALIDKVIPVDNFQLIRAKVAEIILRELPNQATLAAKSYINYTKVWVGRSTPFNLSEVPALNLMYETQQYNNKHNLQRFPTVVLSLDIYQSAKHGAGNVYADELLDERLWNVARVIQGILDHPVYRALELAPAIRHHEVTSITPGVSDIDDSSRVAMLRMTITVETNSVLLEVDPATLAGTDTEVKLNESDKGYFYTSNF